MKKMKKITSLLLITIFVTVSCFFLLVGCSSKPENESEIPKDTTLEEANDAYLEDDYVYNGETEYINFTDIQSQYKNVYSSITPYYDFDHQGDKISLYNGDNEVEFDKGISAAGGDTCITFTDLKMYGYETFSAYFGTHYIARYVESTSTSFSFKITLDYVEVYQSKTFSAYSEYEYIEIDLSGAEAMQIFIDTQGSGTGDYAAIGDPMFIKSSPSPYMDVFDLEFNSPHQVTESNIMQYADAWDLDLTNLADDIYFKTNYVSGYTGDFLITYYVYGSNGVRASREVKLTVTGQDYSDAWTIDDYKTPYVNYMYHTRNTLTPQNRKLFDVAIASVLDFNPNGGEFYTVSEYTKWDETVYELKINLQEAGIFLKSSEFNADYYNTITDSDPRAYIFKQWTATGRYTTDSSTGMLKTYHTFISKSWYSVYDSKIEKIIKNSETFLAYAEDDMTDEQKLFRVTTYYKNWIKYDDGGFISSSLGEGYGKCGGNAMGVVHLAQRLNMLGLYCQVYTSSWELHAASYIKIVDEDGWYMMDKLWDVQFRAPEDSGFHLSKRSGYGWIEYATTSMTTQRYSTYPSIWLEFDTQTILLTKGDEYDLNDNVLAVGNIFGVTMNNDSFTITVTDSNGNVISKDVTKLSSGVYNVNYTVTYETYVTITRSYDVTLVIHNGESIDFDSSTVVGSSNINGSYGNKGLYNSTTKQEEYYYGVDINNGGYITIDNSEGYDVITLKFGPKSFIRTDSWSSSYCKVALYVYFDGVLQYTTATLTAYSNYATVQLYIPEGVQQIKLYSKDVGGSAGHATIADIKFYKIED